MESVTKQPDRYVRITRLQHGGTSRDNNAVLNGA